MTGKFRGEAHWNCNINFQLTKKVLVILHNLRVYDSHLIFNEFDKLDVKISVIPNGLEQKGDYPYEYMNSFERFNEEKLPARKYFYSSIKDVKIGDDGKISDVDISVKDYLTCEKIWNKFEMKNMGDYHDHYF